MRRALTTLMAALSLLVCSRHTRAQSTEPAPARLVPHWFDQGRWEFGVGGQVLSTIDHHTETLGFFTIDAGYYFLNSVSLNVELGFAPGDLSFDSNHDDSALRCFDGLLLLRARPIQSGRFSLFIDGGIGGLHADDRFPRGGQADNFLLGGGLGAAWRLNDNVYFSATARYLRLSGGDLVSDQGTRAFDCIQYTFGLSYIH